MSKQQLVQWLDDHKEQFIDVAKKIWETPEIAFNENFASQEQQSLLEANGFSIITNVGDLPTAFVAEFGTGHPIIGILGEYDALPGLSQTVGVVKEEVLTNGPGHGCGHNLLGTAGVAAVIALKKLFEADPIVGTIRYYGCPAEEVLSGKTFMARAGAFNDLDCALSWHPGTANMVSNFRTSALTSVEFFFTGRTAHAATAHLGRSALDAVELMNIGANYLREHVIDGTRIHYTITNGGIAPNIVPDKASTWYFLRGANRVQVDELLERVLKIAKGAALMTETEVSFEIKAGAYDFNVNDSLNQLMFKQKEDVGPLQFTEEDQAFAEALVQTLDPISRETSQRMLALFGIHENTLLPTEFINYKTLGGRIGGSSDLGDVSWITPVGQVGTTCSAVGIPLHTWQATASFGSPIGFKGMLHAAKIIALSAYELLVDGKEVLEQAKAEFLQSTKGNAYIPAIPNDTKAPVPV
ncbi:amidohydrolase [Paenibacillus macquariensis subsp. defensor]|nr:amidohydrolase [Paenibacillus macquariensis subsp. defensor]